MTPADIVATPTMPPSTTTNQALSIVSPGFACFVSTPSESQSPLNNAATRLFSKGAPNTRPSSSNVNIVHVSPRRNRSVPPSSRSAPPPRFFYLPQYPLQGIRTRVENHGGMSVMQAIALHKRVLDISKEYTQTKSRRKSMPQPFDMLGRMPENAIPDWQEPDDFLRARVKSLVAVAFEQDSRGTVMGGTIDPSGMGSTTFHSNSEFTGSANSSVAP
nr:hypothetical protein Iba_chr07aCG5020 [Ipomoea batatas]